MGYVLVFLIVLAFLAVVAMFGCGIAGAISAAFGQPELVVFFEAIAFGFAIAAAILIVMALLVGWAMAGQDGETGASMGMASDNATGAMYGVTNPFPGGFLKRLFRGCGQRSSTGVAPGADGGCGGQGPRLLSLLHEGTAIVDRMIAQARAEGQDADAARASSQERLRDRLEAAQADAERRVGELEIMRGAWSAATGITREVLGMRTAGSASNAD